MNTDELTDALAALSERAPQQIELRRTVAARVALHLRRRRLIALIASAAAVLIVGAGLGVATHRDFGSPSVAGVPDWQHDRPVDLPAGSSLIRYETPPLISPVTVTINGTRLDAVTPILELQSATGTAGADQLSLIWGAPREPNGNQGLVGYLVSRSVDMPRLGAQNPESLPDTTTYNLTVNGHPAVLSELSGNSAYTVTGLVRMWLTWQLGDGTYIHVWTSAYDGDLVQQKSLLLTVAADIAEHPETLNQNVVVGVTLPGLTASYRRWRPGAGHRDNTPGAISLCPTGTTFDLAQETVPGSCLNVTVVSEDVSFKPSSAQNSSIGDPQPDGENRPPLRQPGRIITVDGLKVHLLEAKHQGYADIGRGFIAVVTAPPTMTANDIAIAVASVRLDPQTCGPSAFWKGTSCTNAVPTTTPTPGLPATTAPSSETR